MAGSFVPAPILEAVPHAPIAHPVTHKNVRVTVRLL